MRTKLSEIYTLQMGKTPARNNYEYWNNGDNDRGSISDLSIYNKYVGGTKETISNIAVKESGIKLVPANTVIMSFKLSIGKTAITVEPTYTNEAIMAFIPTSKYQILPEYAYYLLVKARFVEMFGDPLQNAKGFATRTGAESFKLSNGKFVPEDKRFDEGIPTYGGNGISWYTDDVLCTHDTIVVGRVGFQSGNVHLTHGPIWVTDNAMYISKFHSPEYNLVFLTALMEHIDFTRYQDAGDLKKITQKPFMSMKFIYPPLFLQSQFASFVQAVDREKKRVKGSLGELETLKKALTQEYFG
ncbi:MAG: restriction endonuclease subunit S [Firmicutes bacterium]|nr:restriction endonuclease subunit S [Bacillota bacterium]